MKHLDGKVVVVTGAGRGVGRAVALAAAAQGAAVVVGDYAPPGDTERVADAVAGEIRASGGRAVAVYEDVADRAGAGRIMAKAVESFGRLDGIVCAAGILIDADLLQTREKDWDALVRVHLRGHFACAQAAAEVMIAQKSGGSLVFFSSSSAFAGSADRVAYSSAKGGVFGFTRACASALAPHNISVNGIIPRAATRMTDMVVTRLGQVTDQKDLPSKAAIGTALDPINVAPAILFLLSDAAKGITGQMFGAGGYAINRLAEPAYSESMLTEGPWDIDDVFARFPKEIGSEFPVGNFAWPGLD